MKKLLLLPLAVMASACEGKVASTGMGTDTRAGASTGMGASTETGVGTGAGTCTGDCENYGTATVIDTNTGRDGGTRTTTNTGVISACLCETAEEMIWCTGTDTNTATFGVFDGGCAGGPVTAPTETEVATDPGPRYSCVFFFCRECSGPDATHECSALGTSTATMTGTETGM